MDFFQKLVEKLKLVFLFLALSSLTVISGCGGDNENSGTGNPSGETSGTVAVLAADTKQIDDVTASKILSFDSNSQTIIFSESTPQVQSLSVGNPIIIGVTPAIPGGFMGKITTISTDASGNIVVGTEPAALNEVFEDLTFNFSGELNATNVESVESQFKVNNLSAVAKLASYSGENYITEMFDLSPSENIGHIITVSFKNNYNIDINIEKFKIKKFSFTSNPNIKIVDTLSASAKASLPVLSKTIANIKGTPIPIPGTILTVTPIIALTVSAEGGVEAAVSLSSSREVQYATTINYDGANWSNNFVKTIDEKSASREFKAGAYAQATITPEVDLVISNIAGPYAQFNLIGKLTANPCADPWLKAEVGATANIGVRSTLFDLSKEFMNIELFPLTIVDKVTGSFPYTGVITGVVTDGVTNARVPFVNISFVDDSGSILKNTSTNATGIYSTDLCPCKYTANFSKDGYTSEELIIDDIVGDQVTTRDVTLENLYSIIGSWALINENSTVFTFFDNGIYIQTDEDGTPTKTNWLDLYMAPYDLSGHPTNYTDGHPTEEHPMVGNEFIPGTILRGSPGYPDGHNGVEKGTYTWNPLTGAFNSSCPLIDTNHEWGLSHPLGTEGGCTGSSASVTVSGNTLQMQLSGEALTLSRVTHTTNPIVGSWVTTDSLTDLTLFTFFDNGTYIQADINEIPTKTNWLDLYMAPYDLNGHPTNYTDGHPTEEHPMVGNEFIPGTILRGSPGYPDGHNGLEKGQYTWNSLTGAFMSFCPLIDTNHEWGLSHPLGREGGCTGSSASVTVSGNTLQMQLSGGEMLTLTRVVP